MKFLVLTDGDRSVGINGDRAEVEYDVSTFDVRDQPEVIETIRMGLKDVFSKVMDGTVYVTVPGYDKNLEY